MKVNLLGAVLLSFVITSPVAHAGGALAKPVRFTIVHTNDLHSRFEGNGPDQYVLTQSPQAEQITGHYARLAATIQQVRDEKKDIGPVLLVDSGDFSSGSLFHLLGPTSDVDVAPELDFFSYLNYDAVTLGNHEFEPGEKGLAAMLEKHVKQAKNVPLVTTNMWIEKGSPLEKFYYSDLPTTYFRERIVKELVTDGVKLKIGILGILGTDAAYGSQKTRSKAHFYGYNDKTDSEKWDELVTWVQDEVYSLKSKDKVDIVVVLMHGGHPEDVNLANAVQGIQVIIAGHTHELYPQPLVVNHTIIHQAGAFGDNLGVLDLTFDGWNVHLAHPNDPSSIKIDSARATDPHYLEMIAQYKQILGDRLGGYGNYAYSSFVFTSKKDFPYKLERFNPLGQLVTQGIAIRLNHVLTNGQVDQIDGICRREIQPPDVVDRNPVSLYFTAQALIRSDLEGDISTNYQFSDIFRLLSIGYDKGMNLGYPVVAFYVTQSEFYRLVSIFDLAGKHMPDAIPAFPYALSYRDGWGIPMFNQVKDLEIGGVPYQDCQPLIKVATNLFMLENLITKVATKSFGLINITPKDWQGNPIEISDQGLPKEFVLLSDYFKNNYSN
jgi:2',3'-cyclic-nucleotide 2'-phosphodiesterase (5'-nucleotidase family)